MKRNNFLKISSVLIISISFLSKPATCQETKVMYLLHTGYTAKTDDNPTTKNQSAFNTGGFDLFITSDLNEKLTAVGELFMGFKGDGGTLVDFNIERLYLKYAFNDYFNVRLGRMYTPLGYWNSKYTQGLVFQPTINRPYAVRNQNDKGIMATNSVGLQLDGENIGNLRFSYYFMIDNTVGAPSINTDNTTRKSITAKVKMELIENWELFTSARTDFIASGGKSIQGVVMDNDVKQTILNAGLAHITQESPFETALEYFHVRNDVSTIGKTDDDFMYAYFGYRINKVTPYLMADILRYSNDEQYFIPNDLTGLVVGTRYSILPTAVIKLEYKYRSNEVTNHEDVISIQVAARF